MNGSVHPSRSALTATLAVVALATAARAQAPVLNKAGALQLPCGGDGRIPISSVPFTITSPGSYLATNNLVMSAGGPGITVDADDVTLDLNGFALVGIPGGGTAIYTPSAVENVEVRNGTIRDWNRGLALDGSSRGRALDLRVSVTSVGISVPGGSLVERCEVDGTGTGIQTLGPGCVVRDCVVSNGAQGIVVDQYSTVRDCVVTGNSGVGITALEGSSLLDCTIAGNGGGGVDVGASSLVRNCNVSFNGTGGAGIGIEVGTDSLVDGCTANNSQEAGIWAERASTVSKCVANNNGLSGAGDGIRGIQEASILDSSAHLNAEAGIRVGAGLIDACTSVDNGTGFQAFLGCAMVGCVAKDNSGSGFVPGSASVVEGCLATFNSGHGIEAGARCRVEGNNTNSNSQAGLFVSGGGAQIQANLCSGNGSYGVESSTLESMVLGNVSGWNALGPYDLSSSIHYAAPVVDPGASFTLKEPWANLGF